MSYDPYKIIPAVLVAVIKDGKVLLAKRVNTTYMDGWYGLPGGHLEDNETLQECGAREIDEEVGLEIKTDDLELFHIYQNKNTPGRQYIGFIFRVNKFIGTPFDKEHKVEGAEFFSLDKLPDKIIPYHREALKHLEVPAISITFTGLDSFDLSRK